jgi:AmmeMemoRadiSam system protein B
MPSDSEPEKTEAYTRLPAVAGHFYAGEREALQREVDAFLQPAGERVRALACMVPHAGYVYSGHVAGAVYSRLEPVKGVLIVGPNHRGYGEPLATTLSGAWRTPLGDAGVDESLAHELIRLFPLIKEDELAHRHEHSIEVQLPFLQRITSGFAFAPICVGTANLEVLIDLGEAIAQAVQNVGERVLIVSSSDMNHYESDAVTRIKDSHAIAPILALDPVALYEAVMRERISMCGFAPTVAMLTACKRLDATHAELVKYATSGDINGDRSHVVGYAGIVIS